MFDEKLKSMVFSVSWRYIVLSGLLCLLPVLVLYPFYVKEKAEIYAQIYSDYQTHISNQIDNLIENKQNNNILLATTLSLWPEVSQVLKDQEQNQTLNLKALTQRLNQYPRHQNTWIQLVDAKGVSVLRSWTEKRGDSLVAVRKDIAELLLHPHVETSISVGKYALSLKAIVPLYDQNALLLGFIEIITQFNALDQTLRKEENVLSMILIDKKYNEQLTRIQGAQSFEGYLLTNVAAGIAELAYLKNTPITKVIHANPYVLDGNYFVFSHAIQDEHGDALAYWTVLKPLAKFETRELSTLNQRYLLGAIFGFMLMLLLSVVVFYKRKADFERFFFYQVFNSAKEIIFVSDKKHLIEANQAFFDLFGDIKTLDEFNRRFPCICQLFVDEPGYLQREMGGMLWYDYLLANDNAAKQQYAKITYGNKTIIVSITAAKISKEAERHELISVLMADVTAQETYRQELEHLTIHDELTGLRNRHYFNQKIEEEIHRAQRYEAPLSMISFDIDYFKNVNDQYGHDVGDLVLRQVAQVLLPYVRETDALCRVGGEEFTVIMPETNLQQATALAERLRQAVEKIKFSHITVPLTISLGVVELSPVENFALFYKRADQALYKAKENGRNQVVVG